tara:strand:- start:61 stop:834 length:774 start_codon:yes stop_codon:yes gene_type:complete
MKRALILLTFIILSLSFVSAAQSPREGAETIVDTVIEILEPIAGSLFGGFGSENLLESVLFFVIILALVHVILGRLDIFYNKKAIVWVIAVSVALLSTRFTAEWAWVQFVLLPYNVLGIALLSIIPFIIYFAFITSFDSGAIRKFGWALFVMIYLGLWYTQFEEMGNIAYIYLFAGILGVIMLLSDKYVRGWIIRKAIKEGLNTTIHGKIIDVQKKQEEAMERLTHATSSAQKNSLNKEMDRLKEIEKRLARELRDR